MHINLNLFVLPMDQTNPPRGEQNVFVFQGTQQDETSAAIDAQIAQAKQVAKLAPQIQIPLEPRFGKIHIAKSASECLELSVSLQSISKILFIDAGNCFNPFFIHRNFRDSINTKEALESIFISRPFTIFQLKEAIAQIDSQLLIHKVLIIPCIDDLFYEDGLKIWEAKEVFKQTMELLEKSVEHHNSVCFISFVGRYFRKIYEEKTIDAKMQVLSL